MRPFIPGIYDTSRHHILTLIGPGWNEHSTRQRRKFSNVPYLLTLLIMPTKTPEEQILELQEIEQNNFEEAQSQELEYRKKTFEILEGEVREVIENEGILIRENPLDFPAAVQRKYF